MDKLFIQQLKLETMIGIFPWERNARQQLLVDIVIGTDLQQAATTSNLSHTIDYAEVCQRVATLADQGEFQLLETLAERMANLIFTQFITAHWVKITVHKTDALTQVSSVGVEIERSRGI